MHTTPTRTLALLGATAALDLAVTGCGSGHDGHDGAASTPTTTTATAAGAVDRAFVAQMIPHHELAVAMAAYTKDRAEHPQIRALGADITRTQDAEITAMQAVARTLGVTPAAATSGGMTMQHGGAGGHSDAMSTDARTLGLSMDAMGMSMDMDALKTATPFDRAFIDEMLPHHRGAILMARAELAKGADPELRRIARAIIAAQTTEIQRMNSWRKAWYGQASPAGGVPAP